MTGQSFTGRTRGRRTPKSVRTAERVARAFISAGGIGTIVAVVTIFGFLLWVVAPLFSSASLDGRAAAAGHNNVLACGLDEYRRIGWSLGRDGKIDTFRADDGTPLGEVRLFGDSDAPSAWSFPAAEAEFVFGYRDGTLRTGRISFSSNLLEGDAVPADLKTLAKDQVARMGGSVAVGLGEGRVTVRTLVAEMSPPVKVADAVLSFVDLSITPRGRVFATLADDGRLAVHSEYVRENVLTGEQIRTFDSTELPYLVRPARGNPEHLLVSGVGNLVYLVWRDGTLERYDATDPTHTQLAETGRVVEPGVQVTALSTLIGKSTMVVGDSRGRVRAFFLTKPNDPGTVDGGVLVQGHELAGPASAVTSFSASPRSRLLAAGYADGSLRVFFVTGQRLLAEASVAKEPVASVAFAPKQDGLLAVTATGARVFDFDAKYPEAAPAQLWTKVWYEGYPEPEHAWQSTGGTDDFEPKLGIWRLVVGTLKGTLYSILIATPLALLAAVYTSEFLEARRRARVKATIEMMASLPSVVLGFLAALVIARFIEHALTTTVVTFAAVPFCLLLGARLWQMLPQGIGLRLAGAPRVLAIAASVTVGILLAFALGGPLERLLFAGDVRAWLANPKMGSATGGWVILLLPFSALFATVISTLFIVPWLRHVSVGWSPLACACADLTRYLVAVIFAVGCAWFVAAMFTWSGFDLRQSALRSYEQRNALIVGFVMGFAIVPIIYTLAEDALTSVPVALRAASLGAGATAWQTAWRVVIPTAMSGLFGALMVGLGRAVGETMIVLMASGNTPLGEWTPLSGFRSLSANIAIELPEATRDSAHYRTLFVAALVLFAMTFVVNTAAELVRRRFRKRFAQL